jgi:hypothetical protein
VPRYDPDDYCHWEAINFNRMAHARLLYDFLETPAADRREDDVVSEDFGYKAVTIPLSASDRLRLNKDLMHLTYSRLRHTPATKPWPDSILAMLLDPVVGFMEHVGTDKNLFPSEADVKGWRSLIECLQSGKQMMICCTVDAHNKPHYGIALGPDLPSGKPALARMNSRRVAPGAVAG